MIDKTQIGQALVFPTKARNVTKVINMIPACCRTISDDF